MNRFYVFILTFVISVFLTKTHAQEPNQKLSVGSYPFIYYGVKDGLPQEDVLCIVQDRKYYIWFGTHNGAARYNAREMEYFNEETGLINNSVYDIKEDKEGKIWFATLGGISCLYNDTITNFFTDIPFENIHIDRQQNKWFYGGEGLYCIKNSGEKIAFGEKFFDFKEGINDFAQQKSDDSFFVASSKGIFHFNGNNAPQLVQESDVRSLYIDELDNVWYSAPDGVYMTDKKELMEGRRGIRLNMDFDISEPIKCIEKDKDGTIWLLSDYKAFFVKSVSKGVSVFDKNVGLLNYQILSFCSDHENNLWFGFSGGVQKLSSQAVRNIFPNKIKGYIANIETDKTGRLWTCANNQVYYLTDKVTDFSAKNRADDNTSLAKILPNGNIAFLTLEGLYEYDVNSLKLIRKNIFPESFSYVETFFPTKNGEFFLLTGEEEIIYYLKDFESTPLRIKNQYTKLVYSLVEANGKILASNNTGIVEFSDNTFKSYYDLDFTVWSLLHHKDTLWIGSTNGLGYIARGKYIHLENSPFTGADVNSMVTTDNSDFMWIGTNSGAMCYSKSKQKNVTEVTLKEGLVGGEISIEGLYLDASGKLWIGTYHGLNTFDFDKLKKISRAPVTRLHKIWLNNSKINQIPQKLKFNQNNLVFELVGLSYKDERAIEYEFYMKGLDYDFSKSKGKQFLAHYPNLQPGKYEFVYHAKSKDNLWSNYKSIRFEIQKPFWQTWYFISLLIILVIAIFYLIYKMRMQVLINQKEKLEQIVTERTAEINDQKEEIFTQKEIIEQAYKNIKLLSEIGKQITSSLAFEVIADTVYDNVSKIVELDIFTIGIYDESSKDIYFPATRLNTKTLDKYRISISERQLLPVKCFLSSDEIVLSEKQNFVYDYDVLLHSSFGRNAENIVYIPLTVKNDTIGVFSVQSFKRDTYQDYQIDVLRNLAVYISNALENAKTYDEVKNQKDEIESINVELNQQKEEIHTQAENLQNAYEILEKRNEEISLKNQEITDSINYASRIQSAILPRETEFLKWFKDYFIFYKPKDIVSGDFYWIKKIGKYIVFAASDCTGHGVPGAFMSMLGNAFLNEISEKKDINSTAEILFQLREYVKSVLHQDEEGAESKDGMDIAICAINTETNELQFSGAYNPLIIGRELDKKELEYSVTNQHEIPEKKSGKSSIIALKNDTHIIYEIKGDRKPIGIHLNDQKPFKNYQIKLEKGDSLYIFSDGYADQFGEKTGRKYLQKTLKDNLLTHQDKPLNMQQEILLQNWYEHKGAHHQIDDVLLIGVVYK